MTGAQLLEETSLEQLYLVNYFTAVSTLIMGATPTDLTQGMTLHASMVETFVGLFVVVAGSFLYGQIVGSITELNRKNNMASDVKRYSRREHERCAKTAK